MTLVPASRVMIMRQEGKSLQGTAPVSYPVTDAPVPTVPGQFSAGQWSLMRTGSSNALAVALASLPATGGSPITTVKYRIDGGAAIDAETTGDFTIPGLTLGTPYSVQILARNSVGDGAWSVAKVATPAMVPSAPTLSAEPADGANIIDWSDGAANGAAITARRLYASLVAGFTPGPGNLIATNPTFPFADTPRANGTPVYYKGVSENEFGPSLPSDQINSTPAAEAVVQVVPRYNVTLSRWEVANASAFPGATYVYKDEDSATLATTTSDYLAGSTTAKGVTIEVQGQPATKSVLCFKRANTRIFDINLADYEDGTRLNTIPGVQCVDDYTIQGGKISVPSKITTPITFVAGGGAVAQPGSFLNQSIVYTIDNAGVSGGSDYEGARECSMQVSAADRRLIVVSRGQFTEILRQRGGTYTSLAPFTSQWDGTSGIPNGTTFKSLARQVGGVPYLSSFIKKPDASFKRWAPADTGAGIAYNASGTALEPGNAVRLGGVNSEYNGSNYPKALYQGRIIIEQSAPLAINVYDAVPLAPDIDNPFRIQLTGHSELAGLHEACVLDPDSRQASPFQTFTPSSNLFDFPLTVPDAVLDYDFADVLIGKVGDPSSRVIWKDIAIPAWRPIARNFLQGVNTGSIGSSSPMIFADRALQIRWVYVTINGYQIDPYNTGLTPPTVNGLPRGRIEDAAWNFTGHSDGGARGFAPVLIEGDDTNLSADDATEGFSGAIFPYGTGGRWRFEMGFTPGHYTIGTAARGAASPLSNFSYNSTGFSCDVQEKGPLGNVTTWLPIFPTQNGGKGVDHPDGIPVSFIRTADAGGTPVPAPTNMLLPSVLAAYGREKIIRCMHEHMGGQAIANTLTSYPHSESQWSDMDRFIDLVQSFGPQARAWKCQPIYRVESAPNVIDPFGSYLRVFENLAGDRQRLHARSDYTHEAYVETSNEVFNFVAPYSGYNAPLLTQANVMGFFSGMSAGGTKDLYQKQTMSAWWTNAIARFYNEGVVPDLTGLGFPDVSHLANPAQAMGGRVRSVFGVQGNSQGFTSPNTIKQWFDEAGDTSNIAYISPSSYIYCNINDATLVAALDANNIAAAVTRIGELLTADVATFDSRLRAWSIALRQVIPNAGIVIYEGGWHNDGNHATNTRANRFIQASNLFRETVANKTIEKANTIAQINAGAIGNADFVMYEGFATKLRPSGWTYVQNFGIMSDAGKKVDPAYASKQMRAIGRDEINDLIESWA
ncbi:MULTISPECIES: fibronectin type III domain-containing protein [unclassified Sphingobium]|uniref:fibronectin type III domain-containing protein n=1 Tax=unclassified Sphingobium TaxID=2611147 RepID=UPI0022240BD6|nr:MULTISPECIES: fibronectin type III domain-containing protein [unclassified Sphingobium]MCW2395901.1 hypothetical protein [Sphingobium sp. B8D3B]MCW2419417.1 hypothetical protein [Sphingobium sp. B8D3C]